MCDLRDKFAMAALTGLLSGSGETSLIPLDNQSEFQWIAADCYKFSDAMMEVRKQKSSDGTLTISLQGITQEQLDGIKKEFGY